MATRNNRREFMQIVAAASMFSATSANAANRIEVSFAPCLDWPVRKSTIDPPYTTAIENAIINQGGVVANAPATAGQAQMALGSVQNAPAQAGIPARAPAKAAAMNRWSPDFYENGFFDVYFVDRVNASFRRRVLEIANQWKPFTGFEFRESASSNSPIRCGFNPNGGHYSYVGVESVFPANQNQKSMNLGMDEQRLGALPYNQSVVLHEFGHAIGLVHEHNSPGAGGPQFKTAETLQYFRQTQGWTDAEIRNNVLNRYQQNELLRFTNFDEFSIMLYAFPGELIVGGKPTRQNLQLSNTDKSFVRALYGLTGPIVDPGVGEKPGQTEEPEPKVAAQKALPTDGSRLVDLVSPRRPEVQFTFEINDGGQYQLSTGDYTAIYARLTTIAEPDKGIEPATVKYTGPAAFKANYQLKPGKYRFVVTHAAPGGKGEFWLSLKKN